MSHWTPITPCSGGLTHATSLKSAHRTVCGKIAAQWKVSTERVSCRKCKELLHLPVRARKRVTIP